MVGDDDDDDDDDDDYNHKTTHSKDTPGLNGVNCDHVSLYEKIEARKRIAVRKNTNK